MNRRGLVLTAGTHLRFSSPLPTGAGVCHRVAHTSPARPVILSPAKDLLYLMTKQIPLPLCGIGMTRVVHSSRCGRSCWMTAFNHQPSAGPEGRKTLAHGVSRGRARALQGM